MCIRDSGYTQPIVTIYDSEKDMYTIVDGFHRYFTCKNNDDIRNRNQGCVPIVVINKDINDRMASTVRHNRARGSHSVSGMSNMVFKMLENGWKDNWFDQKRAQESQNGGGNEVEQGIKELPDGTFVADFDESDALDYSKTFLNP